MEIRDRYSPYEKQERGDMNGAMRKPFERDRLAVANRRHSELPKFPEVDSADLFVVSDLTAML